ncbi:MAG TPA: hypothetical protein VIV60_24805 [Polyangiaceae bacterium]
MSISSALMRQLSIRRLGVFAISLALFANACGSSDNSGNNDNAKGGAVSKGGAGSTTKGGSSTGTGGLVGDPWVPPEAKDDVCSIGAADLPLGIGGAANVGAAGASSVDTAGAAGVLSNGQAGSPNAATASAGAPSNNDNSAGSAGTAAVAAPEYLNRIVRFATRDGTQREEGRRMTARLPYAYVPASVEGPLRPSERLVLEEQAGPHHPLELASRVEQLAEARSLLCDAARALLRCGCPAWAVVQAARGVVATLELVERKPEAVARFARGEACEEWRTR